MLTPQIHSYFLLSNAFIRSMYTFRSDLNRGILDRLCHRLKMQSLSRWWKSGNRGKQTCESRITCGCFSNWSFTLRKLLSRQVHKTLILGPWSIKITLTNNNIDHPSVLPFEMYALEPGESLSRSLNWKSLGFLSHIKRRTIGDRFPVSLWEVWFCSTLGVPIPALIGPS